MLPRYKVYQADVSISNSDFIIIDNYHTINQICFFQWTGKNITSSMLTSQTVAIFKIKWK